jgi:hypothetical protein
VTLKALVPAPTFLLGTGYQKKYNKGPSPMPCFFLYMGYAKKHYRGRAFCWSFCCTRGIKKSTTRDLVPCHAFCCTRCCTRGRSRGRTRTVLKVLFSKFHRRKYLVALLGSRNKFAFSEFFNSRSLWYLT